MGRLSAWLPCMPLSSENGLAASLFTYGPSGGLLLRSWWVTALCAFPSSSPIPVPSCITGARSSAVPPPSSQTHFLQLQTQPASGLCQQQAARRSGGEGVRYPVRLLGAAGGEPSWTLRKPSAARKCKVLLNTHSGEVTLMFPTLSQ